MIRQIRAAFAAALLAFPAALGAQDVTLSSFDGAIVLSGDLIAFDGEFYRVETEFGPITVGANTVSCDGPGCPSLRDFVAEIRFVGSPVLTDTLLPALIERFALSRGFALSRIEADDTTTYEFLRGEEGPVAARFEIVRANADAGFDALVNGDAEVALSIRPPRPLEILAADAAGQGDLTDPRRGRIVALDALVPLVSRQNLTGALTFEELAMIYSGEIANWQALDGLDAPIALHLIQAEQGLTQFFVDRVMLPGGWDLADDITFHADARSLSDAVAADPFAIGIASFSEVGNARAIALSGRCGFSQIATETSLRTEDYPLTAPLVLYLPPYRLPAIMRDFLVYTQGAAAGRIVRRAGFVNQEVEHLSFDAQGQRLANAIVNAGDEISLDELQIMITRLSEAARLTPTFRFENGETRLDAVSFAAAERLGRLIEAGEYDGRELIFVGFSDGEGAADANRRLARERAIAVRDAVQLAAPAADLSRVTFRIAAYGEAMPMACDDTEWGRQVNRRVEVWLR